MRELMARNSLEPADFVSVILTCTDDLDAQFPAVGARAVGSPRCRCSATARWTCRGRWSG